MTKLAKIMLLALTLGMFGVYFTSCNKSDSILEDVVEETTQQVVQTPPTTENGWLYFADDAAMETAFIELIQDYGALEQWETKYNHHSLRSRYVDLINTINALEDSGASPEQLIEESKGVIKIKGEGDEAQIVCIVEDMMLSALLNEDGIIQIGNRISKYSHDNKLRVINDGDISKLENIDKIETSDDRLNIEVIDLNSVHCPLNFFVFFDIYFEMNRPKNDANTYCI